MFDENTRSYLVWQMVLSTCYCSTDFSVNVRVSKNCIKDMMLNLAFIKAVHKGRWMKQVKKNSYIYPFKKHSR
jgi:hypothetical protein